MTRAQERSPTLAGPASPGRRGRRGADHRHRPAGPTRRSAGGSPPPTVALGARLPVAGHPPSAHGRQRCAATASCRRLVDALFAHPARRPAARRRARRRRRPRPRPTSRAAPPRRRARPRPSIGFVNARGPGRGLVPPAAGSTVLLPQAVQGPPGPAAGRRRPRRPGLAGRRRRGLPHRLRRGAGRPRRARGEGRRATFAPTGSCPPTPSASPRARPSRAGWPLPAPPLLLWTVVASIGPVTTAAAPSASALAVHRRSRRRQRRRSRRRADTLVRCVPRAS